MEQINNKINYILATLSTILTRGNDTIAMASALVTLNEVAEALTKNACGDIGDQHATL